MWRHAVTADRPRRCLAVCDLGYSRDLTFPLHRAGGLKPQQNRGWQDSCLQRATLCLPATLIAMLSLIDDPIYAS